MSRGGIKLSAGFIILLGMILYIGDSQTILALLIPAAAHELGHVLMLGILGLNIRGFRAELKGFCIEYSGYTGALGHALAAAAGPALGLLYALVTAVLGERLGSQWMLLSSGVSLLLSLFNMLPALPLDGGRILFCLSEAILGRPRAEGICHIVGLVISALILVGGGCAVLSGKGIALPLAGIWLLMCQNEEGGIVKRREII